MSVEDERRYVIIRWCGVPFRRKRFVIRFEELWKSARRAHNPTDGVLEKRLREEYDEIQFTAVCDSRSTLNDDFQFRYSQHFTVLFLSSVYFRVLKNHDDDVMRRLLRSLVVWWFVLFAFIRVQKPACNLVLALVYPFNRSVLNG